MLDELKQSVLEANLRLVEESLVISTWGNVSAIDRDSGLLAIKPSGVPYESLTINDMVIVSLEDGSVVEGDKKPSSDTPTHIEIYKAFSSIGSIVHTHSMNATAFAQARQPIKALGTTHADYFFGDIPCTRPLEQCEVEHCYEVNTGKVISETFCGKDPESIPGVLVAGHGPFCWGKDPKEAVFHAVVLEYLAEMNLKTIEIDPYAHIEPYVLLKHFERKHGPGAYYGQ